MRNAAVIGDPISQSKSPVIHQFWLETLGITGLYDAIHVTDGDLVRFFRDLPGSGLAGVNVTIPHKERALALANIVKPAAARVGAANLVTVDSERRLIADNTDVDGVKAALCGTEIRGKTAVILGAGGASRAALHALREGDIGEVRILTRTVKRGEGLLKEFQLHGRVDQTSHASTALRAADFLINASPMGMTGKEAMSSDVIAALDLLSANALVFDMVYNPLETELLKAARGCDRATSDGLMMLIGQARPAFRAFYGVDAPADAESDEALRARLVL